jgi:hypothetical protein
MGGDKANMPPLISPLFRLASPGLDLPPTRIDIQEATIPESFHMPALSVIDIIPPTYMCQLII